MKISPPIAVLTIAAVGIAVTVWLVPAQPEPPPQGKVSLSTTNQNKAALWIWEENYLSKDMLLLTTAQEIDELFRKAPNESEVPADRTGPRAR